MSWQYRSTSAVATGTTSLTITAPAGVTDNDLLIMYVTHLGSGYATVPAGWDLVVQNTEGVTGVRGEIYCKRAASEPANYSVTGLATSAIGWIDCYDGALLSGTLFADAFSRANASGSKGVNGTSTSIPNALCVMVSFMGGNVNPGTTPFWGGLGPFGLIRTSQQNATGTAMAASYGFILTPQTIGTCDYANNGNGAGNVYAFASFRMEPDVVSGTVTRFYASSRALGTRFTGTPQGDYDQTVPQSRGVHHWNFYLAPAKLGGGVADFGTVGTDLNVSNNQKLYGQRWITDRLAAQVTAGTLDVCFFVRWLFAGAVNSDAKYYIHAYITQGDSLTKRTTILDYTSTGAWTNTRTFRSLPAPQSVSGHSVVEGDRIVVEVSAICSPASTPASDNGYDLGWGTVNAAQEPLADAVSGDTAARAAWIEFSSGLTMMSGQTPVAPVNDACADAVALTLGTISGPHDTRASEFEARGVWFTFTAPRTGRYFASSLGSNYAIDFTVYSGTCGALVSISTQRENAQQGLAQSVAFFDASEGVTYYILAATNYSSTVDPFSCMDSGGALYITVTEQEALAANDLFLVCQHVVRLREGGGALQVKTCQTDFFGLIPSGVALDYSLRPMDDLNGGTHSSERVYIGIFGSGSGDLIEILDALTLNVDELEIDYINAPLNLSELVGALQIVGDNLSASFYGDAYNWIAGLSSATPARIRRLDATHGDNQAGAPWPAAEAFTVTLELQGSVYHAVVADGTIALYTSAGVKVLQYRMSTSTQLADYADVGTVSGDRPGLRQVALLYPFDGSGGMLVAAGTHIKRLNAAGVQIGTYTPSDSARYQDIDKVVITNDATQFYAGDALSIGVVKFDIATGIEIADYHTWLSPGQLSGMDTYLRGQNPQSPDTEPPRTVKRIRRLRRAPHLSSENVLMFHNYFELSIEAGVGLTAGPSGTPVQGEDPQLMLSFSRNGGKTWGNERWTTAGRRGEYGTRAAWHNMGAARDAVYEVVCSDPIFIALLDAYIRVTKGRD